MGASSVPTGMTEKLDMMSPFYGGALDDSSALTRTGKRHGGAASAFGSVQENGEGTLVRGGSTKSE